MKNSTKSQSEMSPAIQFAIGLSVSIFISAIVVVLALLHIGNGLPFWIGVFFLFWFITFVAVRKQYYTMVVAALFGVFICYLLTLPWMHAGHL